MPFKSEDQRRWMYANKPEMAKAWEAHTPDKKLPKKISTPDPKSKLHEYLKKYKK